VIDACTGYISSLFLRFLVLLCRSRRPDSLGLSLCLAIFRRCGPFPFFVCQVVSNSMPRIILSYFAGSFLLLGRFLSAHFADAPAGTQYQPGISDRVVSPCFFVFFVQPARTIPRGTAHPAFCLFFTRVCTPFPAMDFRCSALSRWTPPTRHLLQVPGGSTLHS